MQKLTITLSFDEEKLRALETYLKMQDSSVQKKLEEAMGQLYEQMVPKEVQRFVEALSTPKPKATSKPKPKPEARKDAVPEEQS